jgi:hypothetical protein
LRVHALGLDRLPLRFQRSAERAVAFEILHVHLHVATREFISGLIGHDNWSGASRTQLQQLVAEAMHSYPQGVGGKGIWIGPERLDQPLTTDWTIAVVDQVLEQAAGFPAAPTVHRRAANLKLERAPTANHQLRRVIRGGCVRQFVNPHVGSNEPADAGAILRSSDRGMPRILHVAISLGMARGRIYAQQCTQLPTHLPRTLGREREYAGSVARPGQSHRSHVEAERAPT